LFHCWASGSGEAYHRHLEPRRRRKMGWRMADGGWQMADGGWRMADGGWRMAEPYALCHLPSAIWHLPSAIHLLRPALAEERGAIVGEIGLAERDAHGVREDAIRLDLINPRRRFDFRDRARRLAAIAVDQREINVRLGRVPPRVRGLLEMA